jgi:glycosyltransferase involved in cell wall biosynthesis
VRIALVGPTYPYKGGIAQYTTELAHQMSGAGHAVVIESWSHQYPRLLYPGQLTITTPELAPFPRVKRALSWRRPDTWYRVGRRLRGADLVVLVVGTPIQMPAYRGVLVGLGRNRPPVVAQCHNVVPHERRPVDRFLMRSVLMGVDGVLVHSDAEQAQARELTNRPVVTQPMAPILVARRGVDRMPGEGTVHRRLLFFGMVRPYKGLDILLRALARCPERIDLLVSGEFWGGAEPTTRQLVTNLGLTDRVELRPGYVDAAEVPGLFADVDALVLPYRAGTASFNAYLAFEHGCPVIATRVGTAEADIRDGVDGLLCEPGDADSLAEALCAFYRNGMADKLRAGVPTVDPTPKWQAYVAALFSAARLEA